MSKVSNLISRWKEIIIISLCIRVVLFILPIIITLDTGNIFNVWVRWDGPHYIDIAQNGYQSFGDQSLWIVFYPLYPFLIKLSNFLINDLAVSSVLVSFIFSFSASILLFELTLLDFSKKTATLAVWFLNIYPTSYFLQASYTESLFLTMSLASIYFVRKNQLVISAVAGLSSSLTRINGMLLIPLILMETKKLTKSLPVIALILTGFVIYLMINYFYFGDLFYYIKPLTSFWYKHFDWPWNGIFNGLQSIQNYTDEVLVTYFFEFVSIIFILILTIFVYLQIRKSYAIYMLTNLVLFTSTSFILSTPRYSIILFPIFIALAKIPNKKILILISFSFIFLLIYFTLLYTQGKWAF